MKIREVSVETRIQYIVKSIEAELSGIFCKSSIEKHEVSLPLIELVVSQDHPNFQMIEDYWQWFWR